MTILSLISGLNTLPFFPEIRKSQALGRLVFSLLSQAGYNQDHNGDHIGKGFEYLLGAPVQARYIQIKDVQTAKQDRTPDGINRFPQGEDDKGDCKPASVAESVVGPGTAGVFHDKV